MTRDFMECFYLLYNHLESILIGSIHEDLCQRFFFFLKKKKLRNITVCPTNLFVRDTKHGLF